VAHTTSKGNLLHDDDSLLHGSHLLPVDFGMVAEGIDTGTVLSIRLLRKSLVAAAAAAAAAVVPVVTLPAAEEGSVRDGCRRPRRRCRGGGGCGCGCAHQSLPAAKKAFRGQGCCTCSYDLRSPT